MQAQHSVNINILYPLDLTLYLLVPALAGRRQLSQSSKDVIETITANATILGLTLHARTKANRLLSILEHVAPAC